MDSDTDMRELAERIYEKSRLEDISLHSVLTDLRRFDVGRGWASLGQQSCARWLNWRCGIGIGAGREKLRVAHALADLPKTDEALRTGQLSYSKARAITRVATAETEEKFLETSRVSSASHLERICREHAQQNLVPEAANEPEQWIRVRNTSRNMVHIGIQLRPDEATRLLKAIDAMSKDRLDGIFTMAEAALRGDEPQKPATQVTVHIDAATLTGYQEDLGIPPETCRRILCDGEIAPVLEDSNGMPLEVGRTAPTFSMALRQALGAAGGGCCRFPGCTNRKFLEGHYVRHWIDGGAKTLENAIYLCRRHHWLVHEGGYRLVVADKVLRFYAPDGVELGPTGTCPPRAQDVSTEETAANDEGAAKVALAG